MQPAAKATDITATARITSTGTLAVKVKITVAPVSSSPPAPKLPVVTALKQVNFTVPMSAGMTSGGGSGVAESKRWDWYGAMNGAASWAQGGSLVGVVGGCLVGGIGGAVGGAFAGGVGAIPGAFFGCEGGGEIGAVAGGVAGGFIGWGLGGTSHPAAGKFDWIPNVMLPLR